MIYSANYFGLFFLPFLLDLFALPTPPPPHPPSSPIQKKQSYKWAECFGIKFKKTVCISLTFFLPFFCTVITIPPRHCVVVLIYSSKIFIILTVHLCCFLYLFTVIVPSYFISIDLFRQNALPLLLSLYQKK